MMRGGGADQISGRHLVTLQRWGDRITADTAGNKITIITLVSVWPAQSQVSAVIITLQIFTLGRIARLQDM